MIIALLILAGIMLLPVIVAVVMGVGGLLIAIIVGVCFGIAALVIKGFISPWFENRDRMRLDTDHIMIQPQSCKVRRDPYSAAYVIDCYYKDPGTGREFVFSSSPLDMDPSPYVDPSRLVVFVNSVDYSNYYVDTSRLGLG